jgi:hypothetical protein
MLIADIKSLGLFFILRKVAKGVWTKIMLAVSGEKQKYFKSQAAYHIN